MIEILSLEQKEFLRLLSQVLKCNDLLNVIYNDNYNNKNVIAFKYIKNIDKFANNNNTEYNKIENKDVLRMYIIF